MKTDSYDIDQAFDIYNQQAQSRSNLDYNEWKMDDIISWIISLDDKYKQYENSLKDNFIKHGVNGSHLKYIDKHDLHNWGITDFGHKISIWNQLCELVKDVNNGYGEDEEDEEEEPLTYVLELPREMLTAYILLSLTDKFRDDWNEMGFCGRFGIFLAYALPFGVQIIVTMALMSEVKPEKLRISTGPQDLIFNLCALSILFIYIFYKIVGLIKTTWYFLNKLKREFDKKQEEIERQKISHEEFSLSSPADELRKQLTKSMEELKSIQLKDIDEIGMDQDDRTWIIIYAFRLQIILVLVLYFGLMMYAIVRINSNKHIVDKLEVAISIFFILEVDDWAYILFLGQNMILNDSDFNIEMTAKREGHSKQLKRNTCHLWISLFIVFIGVVGVVLGSNWLYDLLN